MSALWKILEVASAFTSEKPEQTGAGSALRLQGGSRFQEAPPVLSIRACSVWRLQLSPNPAAAPGRCRNAEAPGFFACMGAVPPIPALSPLVLSFLRRRLSSSSHGACWSLHVLLINFLWFHCLILTSDLSLEVRVFFKCCPS